MGSRRIAQNLLPRAVAGAGGKRKPAIFCLSSPSSSLSSAAGADPPPPTPGAPNVVRGRAPIRRQRRQSPMPFPSPPSPEDLNLNPSVRRYREQIFPPLGFGIWHSPEDPEIQSLAEYAVQEYNRKKKDAQFQLVKILEAHAVLVAGFEYGITMEVTDASMRKFHVHVWVWERSWMKPNPRQLMSWCRVKN